MDRLSPSSAARRRTAAASGRWRLVRVGAPSGSRAGRACESIPCTTGM